jgi:anti-anti-sigma factor
MTTVTQPLASPVSCPAPQLSIEVSEVGRAVVIRLAGEARVLEVARLQWPFARLVACRAPFVVVDVGDLTFISSLAMGALVALRRDLGRFGGHVTIVGARPTVYEALESTGLHLLFEFCPTVAEALAAG